MTGPLKIQSENKLELISQGTDLKDSYRELDHKLPKNLVVDQRNQAHGDISPTKSRTKFLQNIAGYQQSEETRTREEQETEAQTQSLYGIAHI